MNTIYKHKCKHCNREIITDSVAKIGAHVRNCDSNPDRFLSYKSMIKISNERQKELHISTVIKYENNKKACKNCGENLSFEKRNNEFCNNSCSATFHNEKRKKPKKLKKVIKYIDFTCQNCGKTINLRESIAKKKKYCSGKCRNNVNNKIYRGTVSKAEKMLYEKLIKLFPTLEIFQNDRNILNGLELDIYIPMFNIGIEWNGIYHYENIHNDGSYEKTVLNDNKKINLCSEKNIELIIVKDLIS